MKKTQIVAEMAEKTGLNKTQSEAALVAFLETISDALGGEYHNGRVSATVLPFTCIFHNLHEEFIIQMNTPSRDLQPSIVAFMLEIIKCAEVHSYSRIDQHSMEKRRIDSYPLIRTDFGKRQVLFSCSH